MHRSISFGVFCFYVLVFRASNGDSSRIVFPKDIAFKDEPVITPPVLPDVDKLHPGQPTPKFFTSLFSGNGNFPKYYNFNGENYKQYQYGNNDGFSAGTRNPQWGGNDIGSSASFSSSGSSSDGSGTSSGGASQSSASSAAGGFGASHSQSASASYTFGGSGVSPQITASHSFSGSSSASLNPSASFGQSSSFGISGFGKPYTNSQSSTFSVGNADSNSQGGSFAAGLTPLGFGSSISASNAASGNPNSGPVLPAEFIRGAVRRNTHRGLASQQSNGKLSQFFFK